MNRLVRMLPLLMALFCSIWLLSTRMMDLVIWDAFGELFAGLLLLLSIPAFAVSLVSSLYYVVIGWTSGRLLAVLPLAINLFALAIFLPVDREFQQRNFYSYLAERNEIVQRIESGELWSGSPLVELINLPREYPRAVSNGVGQRQVMVYHDDALNVVFYPKDGLGERMAFLYRSSGDPPTIPNPHLPDATWSQPLGGNWYRVVFRYF